MEWGLATLSLALNSMVFLVAFLLALLVVYGLITFYYRPVTAIRWVIWIFAIETIVVIKPSLPVGIQLFVPDVLFLLIGISGLLRIFSIKLYREHYAWLLFGAILMLSFGMGTVRFGTAAGVEFRGFFYFWCGIWYLITFPISSHEVDRIIASWMFASAVIVGAAIFRWMAMAAGSDIVRYWNEGGNTLRVLSAAETYFLSQAFVIGLYAHLTKTGPRWWKVLLPLLLICIVILQHRTVWVVTAVSIAMLFLATRKIRSSALSTLFVTMVVGSAVLIPLVFGGHSDPVQQSLTTSVAEVGKENSTMVWRIQSWQALLQQWAHGGPLVNLFGFPFGSGFARHIEASQQELNYSPHSQYVTVLLRSGVIGIAAMLSAYYIAISAVRRSSSRNTSQLADNNLLLALLVAQLLFFLTYSIHYIHLLPLALSLVILGRARRQSLEGRGAPSISAKGSRMLGNWG